MKSKARVINIIMNASIAVLAISAIYLLILAIGLSPEHLIQSLFDGGEKAVVTTGTESVDSITTSTPYIVLLTDDYGAHYAAKYDYQTKLKVFSQFSVTLGEALGSASEASQVKESEWRSALKTKSVFFDYLYPQPLSLIARQLGTNMPEDSTGIISRRLCLAVNGDSLNLYYIDEATGAPFRLNTALQSSLFFQQTADSGLSLASFAFESDSGLSRIDPYFVFSGESISINAVLSASPLSQGNAAQISLADFSMNERASKPYSVGDFTTVYVEDVKSLRTSATGSVLFTVTGSKTDGIPVSYSGDSPTLDECILSAASLISSTIAPRSGDAEIGLISMESERSGGFTLTFGYYVNGIPVNVASTGWCAKIIISGGNIVRAELIYREYSVQGELLSTLPEEQAAILSQNQGGSPLLFYKEDAGALTPLWYNNR